MGINVFVLRCAKILKSREKSRYVQSVILKDIYCYYIDITNKSYICSMITIQKGIPIPDTTAGRPAKYPFHEMEVGDSFELNDVPKNTVLNAATSWARRHNKKAKFSIRFENGTTRIWRIK